MKSKQIGKRSLSIVRHFFPKVKSVIDADSNLAIEVTAGDVSKSEKKQHAGCALAVACKRKFNLDGVIISRNIAYMVKGTKARRFFLPPSAEKEVVSFDRGGGFELGEYELSRPYKSARLGAAKGGRSGSKEGQNSGNLAKRFSHLTTNIRASLIQPDEAA